MDDQFKKASEDAKFSYQSAFWNEVESKLEDDSLDAAFVAAAGTPSIMPDFNITESIDDAFLDDAFRPIEASIAVDYSSEYWNQFQANLEAIQQDEAFVNAANAVTADYHPHYWSDADIALQNEGLHYEYSAAYWNEAKILLDKSDRGNFFIKWSAVAGILLLLSFATLVPTTESMKVIASTKSNSSQHQNVTNHSIINSTVVSENRIVDSNNESYTSYNLLDNNDNAAHTELQLTENDITLNDSQIQNLIENNNLELSNLSQDNNTDLIEVNNDFVGLNLLREKTSPKKDELVGDIQIKNMKLQAVNVLQSTVGFVSLSPNIHIEKLKLSPSHHISLLGQIGLGNKYDAQDLSPTWRSAGGFEYLFTPRKSLQRFEFGASFMINHVRQNNFGTERRVNVFQNTGSVDKFWYKLQLKDMVYGGANFGINYKLNSRNKVKFSLGCDYLIFAQSNMSYQNKADESITTVNNNWGVKDGLNKLDFKVGLGYEFQVTSRFAFQVNASFGILDRTDNQFMRNQIYDHEMSGSVGLKYTIFRK